MTTDGTPDGLPPEKPASSSPPVGQPSSSSSGSQSADGEEVTIEWQAPPRPSNPARNRHRLLLPLVAAGVVVAVVTTLALVGSRASSPGTVASGASSSVETVQPTATQMSPSTATSSPSPTPTTSPRPDFTAAAASVSPSILRVVASTCRGTGVGSAFWISDSMLVTSYHSVAEAVSTAVVDASGTTAPATIVGTDRTSGIAVLEVNSSAVPDVLQIDSAQLDEGDWVASIGIPSRRSEVRTAVARIGRTDLALTHRGVATPGLAVLPGAVDVGLGGAPVITADGSVVGAVFALPQRDQRLVVPGSRLVAGVEAALAAGAPEPGDCARPTGPYSQTQISGETSAAMRRGLEAYFGGINAADYRQAYNALGPAFHDGDGSLDDFAPGWVSSYDFNIEIQSTSGGDSDRTWITFDSIFADGRGPEDGVTCAHWSIDYSFVRDGDRLEINANKAHGGGSQAWTAC